MKITARNCTLWLLSPIITAIAIAVFCVWVVSATRLAIWLISLVL